MKRFISWNVNGIRACLDKGFVDTFYRLDADIFCIQESKCQEHQLSLELDGYHQYWSCAEKKGYSGTAVFSRQEPISVKYGIGSPEHDIEGRCVTLEFDDYFLVTVYSPNSQEGLKRLDFRMDWEDRLAGYLKDLDLKKPVILCGDLNVAHKEIDLKNPKANIGNAGFSIEERDKFQNLLDGGFVDSFRYLYPDLTGAYSWWSYRFNARANNAGWRIDYFCISERLTSNLLDSKIHSEIFGSDHCPVEITIDL